MLYLPSHISRSCASHTGFSAILLPPVFPLITLCMSFRSVPTHLRVLCTPGPLGCCSNASVVCRQKVLGALRAVFHSRVTMHSLPSCVRTEWDYRTVDNSYHTPAWYWSASRDQDCTSDLSLVLLSAPSTTCRQIQCSTVHLPRDLLCFSATPAGFLSIRFLRLYLFLRLSR